MTTHQPYPKHTRAYLRTRTTVRAVFYSAMSAPLVIIYINLLLQG